MHAVGAARQQRAASRAASAASARLAEDAAAERDRGVGAEDRRRRQAARAPARVAPRELGARDALDVVAAAARRRARPRAPRRPRRRRQQQLVAHADLVEQLAPARALRGEVDERPARARHRAAWRRSFAVVGVAGDARSRRGTAPRRAARARSACGSVRSDRRSVSSALGLQRRIEPVGAADQQRDVAAVAAPGVQARGELRRRERCAALVEHDAARAARQRRLDARGLGGHQLRGGLARRAARPSPPSARAAARAGSAWRSRRRPRRPRPAGAGRRRPAAASCAQAARAVSAARRLARAAFFAAGAARRGRRGRRFAGARLTPTVRVTAFFAGRRATTARRRRGLRPARAWRPRCARDRRFAPPAALRRGGLLRGRRGLAAPPRPGSPARRRDRAPAAGLAPALRARRRAGAALGTSTSRAGRRRGAELHLAPACRPRSPRGGSTRGSPAASRARPRRRSRR